VNNDFHSGQTIFEVLSGLECPDMDKVPEAPTNGTTATTNGVHKESSGDAATNGNTKVTTNGTPAPVETTA
jgi:hypothetical protein